MSKIKRNLILACALLLSVITVTGATETYLHLANKSGRRYFQMFSEPYIMSARKFDPDGAGYRRGSADLYSFDYSNPVQRISERYDKVFPRRTDDKNILKVIVLGASVADGVGASSSDRAWFTILENNLTAKLKRKVVLERLTMPGYVSTQERVALDLIGFDRCPDHVMIFDGFADLSTFLYNARPGDPYDQVVSYELARSSAFRIGFWLSQKSEIFNTLWRFHFNRKIAQLKSEFLMTPLQQNQYVESVNSVYFNNVDAMLTQCRWHKVGCSVFLQPARALLTKEENGDELLAKTYNEARRRVTAAAENGKPIFDLTHVFDSVNEKIFLDRAHFNDLGQILVAQAMEPILEKYLRSNFTKTQCLTAHANK